MTHDCSPLLVVGGFEMAVVTEGPTGLGLRKVKILLLSGSSRRWRRKKAKASRRAPQPWEAEKPKDDRENTTRKKTARPGV